MDTPDIDTQGQRLVQRAASPGVTHGRLPVRRMEIGGGAALATEIQRRWAPAAEAGWGSGPALHYAGTGAAPGAPAVPTVQAAPAAPRAHTVGEAASPAAQSEAPMGASLQRQHMSMAVGEGTPTTPAAPMPVVQRKAAAAVTAAPASLSRGAGEGRGGGAASTMTMPAIVRRSPAGSSPAAAAATATAAGAPLPLSRAAGEGRGGGSPVATAAPVSTVTGPAIVHRSASRPLTPNLTGLRPDLALPSSGRGGQGARGPEPAAAIQAQRSAAPAPAPAAPTLSASASGLAMPLARSAAPASSGTETASGTPSHGTPSHGGLIQRQAIGGESGEASFEAGGNLIGTSALAPSAAAGASATDDEDVVELVTRRLTRTLAVESERHGARRWP